MKLQLCHYAGCSLISKNYYCNKHQLIADKKKEEHKKMLFKGTQRTSSKPYHQLYNCKKWRVIRSNFLKVHCVCIICGGKATIADHIIPHKGDERLFYNENNLQPMCWRCHSAKTLKENNYFKK